MNRPWAPRLALGALGMSLALPADVQAQAAKIESPLVTTQWVADHLNDPSVVVLHVAFSRREYNTGHIPGSRFFWFGDFADDTPDLSTELQPVARLDSVLEALGVSDNSKIVLYGERVTQFIARGFVTLDYLGAGDRTAIMDGGFKAWKDEGRQVSTETPKVARGKFTPRINAEAVVNAEFVKANVDKQGVKILDARTPNFYAGEGGGGQRPGHVQSAMNIPFTTLTDSTGKMKDRAALTAMFDAAGVQPSDKVVTYCHVGQQGSLLFFASRVLGHRSSLYDGSFEDWSSRQDTPIVGPVKK